MIPGQEAKGYNLGLFDLLHNNGMLKLYGVYSLELPHQGNSNENTHHTIS